MINVRHSTFRSAGLTFHNFRVARTNNGLEHIQLTATVGHGQSWDKEFPKIVAAIMALTGVHDPALITINDTTLENFAAA